MIQKNKAGAPPLPSAAQARIGLKLREFYDNIVQEPVPDRFRQLLADLEKAQGDERANQSTPTTANKGDGGTGR